MVGEGGGKCPHGGNVGAVLKILFEILIPKPLTPHSVISWQGLLIPLGVGLVGGIGYACWVIHQKVLGGVMTGTAGGHRAGAAANDIEAGRRGAQGENVVKYD